jgi:hypothetical protein
MFLIVISLALLSLASSILAKTDLAGCTSSDVVVNGGASVLYYVPGSGEICSFLDCGGGRAPPKSDVPGCPAYTGAEAYSPSFLSGFGPAATFTPTGPVPTGSILTDTSIAFPASTLVPIASTVISTGLTDTTTTLGAEGSGSAAPSLVTSALVYDTAVASQSVTNKITVTTSAPTSGTANAATGTKAGREFVVAVVGVAAAGIAML